ncbi:MAG: hypothetical protein ACOCSK_00010 [Rhodothermales bacterium]
MFKYRLNYIYVPIQFDEARPDSEKMRSPPHTLTREVAFGKFDPGRSYFIKSVGVMKKAENLLRGIGLSFCALIVAGSLTLTGCNMDSLGGPALDASLEDASASKNGAGSITKGDAHNDERSNKNGAGSITKGDAHNDERSN